jgi:hypothetical protein
MEGPGGVTGRGGVGGVPSPTLSAAGSDFGQALSFQKGADGGSQVSKALQDKNSSLAQFLGLGEGLDAKQAEQLAYMLQEIQSGEGYDKDKGSLSKEDLNTLVNGKKAEEGGEGQQGSESPTGSDGGRRANGKDKLTDVNGDGKVNFLDKIMTELAKQKGMSPEEFAKIADKSGDGKVDLKEMLAAAQQGGATGGQQEQSNQGGQGPLAGGPEQVNFV